MDLSKHIKVSDDSNNAEKELNSLIAEEFEAWYNYFIFSQFLVGNERSSVEMTFMKLASDELHDHAFKLINRLNELGLHCCVITPDTWRLTAQQQINVNPDCSVKTQLKVNKEAEEGAIRHYKLAIEYFQNLGDIITVELLKAILADEEEHLCEINDFLEDIQHSNL